MTSDGTRMEEQIASGDIDHVFVEIPDMHGIARSLQVSADHFLEAWREHGLDGTYLPQPGDNHFTAIEGFLDAESPLCEAIFEQMELDRTSATHR